VIWVKLVDVHCHLDSPKYTKLDELIARNKENGIVGIVAAASDFASCQRMLGLGKKYG
jgi:Tat protein secretion system quality control protein TatD with DNase activity